MNANLWKEGVKYIHDMTKLLWWITIKQPIELVDELLHSIFMDEVVWESSLFWLAILIKSHLDRTRTYQWMFGDLLVLFAKAWFAADWIIDVALERCINTWKFLHEDNYICF